MMRKVSVALFCGALMVSLAACENKVNTQPKMEAKGGSVMTIENGRAVSIDYTLTVDGQVVDSSQGRGPLSYTHGQQQIVPGLERQLAGLKAGDERTIVVEPQEAYGEINAQGVQDIPKSALPGDFEPKVGMVLNLQTEDGQQRAAIIKGMADENITIDFNHPLAGKTLEFQVKVVKVE